MLYVSENQRRSTTENIRRDWVRHAAGESYTGKGGRFDIHLFAEDGVTSSEGSKVIQAPLAYNGIVLEHRRPHSVYQQSNVTQIP